MQEPMNRRRFLELSALMTPFTELRAIPENFSPHLSELAFITSFALDWDTPQPATCWNNENALESTCYDISLFENHLDEAIVLNQSCQPCS